jgi:ATP-binding cassette subfamily F protein uup
VGIIGPNGAGKSTFLDILAGKVQEDAGTVSWGETVQVGYYDQQSAELPDDKRVIELIQAEAPLLRTAEGERVDAARVLEWFLFSRAEQQTYVGSLSGGERRRLYLLRTLVHRPNVLILDEPTNDLDIQTLTVLESFLDHFKGSLIAVSHDRYFLDRVVDFLYHFEDGAVDGPYPAPFSSYRRLRREQEHSQPKAQKHQVTERAATKPAQSPKGSARKLSWKEARELETLERQIATMEEEKGALTAAVNDSGDDYERLRELATELQALNERLDEAMERWLELAQVAETD